MTDQTKPQIQQGLADLRISTMFETISAQRNSALNDVANLTAENAVLRSAITHQTHQITELTTTMTDLRQALSEAQAALAVQAADKAKSGSND